jgi:hypothetical protein
MSDLSDRLITLRSVKFHSGWLMVHVSGFGPLIEIMCGVTTSSLTEPGMGAGSRS